jgi:hypothetical protein
MNAAESNPELFGLLAEFTDPDELLAQTKKTYQSGYRHIDTYTPFPVHGLGEAMGIKHNLVPYVVGLGALLGGLGGFFLQFWTSVMVYPLNIGGRPLNSWPAFMVITFETAVLGAGILGVVGMLALNKLPQPYHPVFRVPEFIKASNDRFFLCIMNSDPMFDPEKTRAFLEGMNPAGVYPVEQDPTTKVFD